MIPDFLLVGFAKCGTTSIQNMLERHPDIYLPIEKETQFLYLDFEYKKGMKNYEQRFYDIPPDRYKRVGGIEPSWAGASERVSRHFPKETKLIFMMRNPADFAYSLYPMETCLGVFCPDNIRPFRLNACFEYELRKAAEDRKFDLWEKDFNGFYADSIRDFLRFFPKENMLFLFFEDLKENEQKVVNEICRFLEVDEFRYIPGKVRHTNENARFLSGYAEGMFNAGFRRAVYWLKEHNICDLEYSRFVDTIRNHITTEDKSKMMNCSRRKLERVYEQSVRELEELTGRDLKTLWF